MIENIRTMDVKVIALGIHAGVIQSMLDYDFMIGRSEPSILAVVAKGRSQERFFWGKDETSLRVYPDLSSVSLDTLKTCTMVINTQSARHVKNSTLESIALLPQLRVISIFAENTPELHSLQIRQAAAVRNILVVGPSSVGLLIPGVVKLGAIGGTLHEQLVEAHVKSSGDIAVVTTSGGVINELIRTVTLLGHGISFALAMGGDRFPITEPVDAIRLAQADTLTKRIVYFGELGGTDEYEIAKLIKDGEVTKPIIVYIAGKVAELFPTPPQFGHAKALARTRDESAEAKKKALREAGAMVCDSFAEIASFIGKNSSNIAAPAIDEVLDGRRKSYFMSHISGEIDGNVQLLGKNLTETVNNNTVASLVISMLLGEQITSKKVINFVDYVLRLLADHSPNVSGAVNTMIASRAGKDLVSSLTAGLLTIGPRFGGAINAAAKNWLEGVEQQADPQEFVESITRRDGAISGIGHKKYRIDIPDPRVEALMVFSGESRYITFARSVEAITLTKKSNLILNVDGAIAAIMLDLLKVELKYTDEQLKQLVSIEFFNALFVLSRSIGFTAHYLDQRRHDEGLFRLDDEDVRYFYKEDQRL